MGLYEKNITVIYLIYDYYSTIFSCKFSYRKKERYKNRNTWTTKELKSDIIIRDQLYKLMKRSPTPENIKTYKNTNLSKQRKAERLLPQII